MMCFRFKIPFSRTFFNCAKMQWKYEFKIISLKKALNLQLVVPDEH